MQHLKWVSVKLQDLIAISWNLLMMLLNQPGGDLTSWIHQSWIRLIRMLLLKVACIDLGSRFVHLGWCWWRHISVLDQGFVELENLS